MATAFFCSNFCESGFLPLPDPSAHFKGLRSGLYDTLSTRKSDYRQRGSSRSPAIYSVKVPVVERLRSAKAIDRFPIILTLTWLWFTRETELLLPFSVGIRRYRGILSIF